MNMKKLLALFIVFVLVLCAIPFTAAAAEESSADTTESVEIVLLLDVSGSMEQADPLTSTLSRVSIEAAQQFVFNYPTSADMYIKVIPYNYQVYEGFDSVNVSTESGMMQYVENMQLILHDYNSVRPDDPKFNQEDNLPGFRCWWYQTDIGGALEAATKVVTESTADKQAVILFTDGRIELANDEQEAISAQKAADSSQTLDSLGVPIYCVGLNKNNSVDEDFLRGLSDTKNAPGKTTVVTKATELTGVFQEIYTYLFDNSLLDEDVDEIVVSPDVEEHKSLRIYGQAVKEANISLTSNAALHSIKVTAPANAGGGQVVVANVDLTKTGSLTMNFNGCVINTTPSHSTATIKLLNPVDGDWTISLTGEASTVMVSNIYLFDLTLHENLSTEKIYVDDLLSFNTAIYNAETNTHIKSAELYTGSTATATVINRATSANELFVGTLNSAQNGFDFSVACKAPGVHEIGMSIVHDQFAIQTQKTVEVIGPTLKVSTTAFDDDGKCTVTVYLVNPLTGNTVSSLPAYLNGANGKVTISSGTGTVKEHAFDWSDLSSGSYSFTFDAPRADRYSVSASLSTYDTTLTTDEQSMEAVGPELKVSASTDDNGKCTIKVYLTNSQTGEMVSSLPAYLNGANGTITILSGTETVKEQTFTATDLSSGSYSFVFDAPRAGQYAVNAKLTNDNTTLEASSQSITVKPSTITVTGDLPETVSKSGFSASFTETITLKDAFSDSDGDTLTYTVSVGEDGHATAVIEGTDLIITSESFGKTEITVTVTDGKGAEATYVITVKTKSTVGTVVALVIVAIVLIVAVVIFLIILNKSKVIRFGFRVQIIRNESENYTEAVFNVGRLASNRHAKPTMKLDTLLSSNNSFSQILSSDIDDSVLDAIVAGCNGISVTGVPFKRAFTITVKGKKKGTFTKSRIRVELPENNCSVVFGSVNDFNNDDLYGY